MNPSLWSFVFTGSLMMNALLAISKHLRLCGRNRRDKKHTNKSRETLQ